MSIAQLFDCFTCHRFLRAPPGGFRWRRRAVMNAVSVNKAEMCGEVSNRRGKSEERTDAFFLFVCLFFENDLSERHKKAYLVSCLLVALWGTSSTYCLAFICSFPNHLIQTGGLSRPMLRPWSVTSIVLHISPKEAMMIFS